MKISFLIFAISLIASLSQSPLAQAEIYTGAVSAAAGGAGRAAVESGTASFLNPAMLVHQKGSQFYTAYTQNNIAVSLTENSEDSLLPTSLGYLESRTTLKTNQVATDYKAQNIRLALGEFIKGGLSVGITGHFYQVVTEQKTAGQFNMDLGFALTPVPNVGLALVFYDLGTSNTDIPPELRIAPTVGIGFHHIFRNYFHSRLDLVSGPQQDFAKSTLMLGFESYLNQWIVTRAGYQSNKFLALDLYSAGFGFDLPRFRTNYAFQMVAGDSKDQRHSVDLSIPF